MSSVGAPMWVTPTVQDFLKVQLDAILGESVSYALRCYVLYCYFIRAVCVNVLVCVRSTMLYYLLSFLRLSIRNLISE